MSLHDWKGITMDEQLEEQSCTLAATAADDRSPRSNVEHYESLWACERQASNSSGERTSYQRWSGSHD